LCLLNGHLLLAGCENCSCMTTLAIRCLLSLGAHLLSQRRDSLIIGFCPTRLNSSAATGSPETGCDLRAGHRLTRVTKVS
jgi:hypothetical protein